MGSTKNCDTTQEKGELFANDFLDIPKQQINVFIRNLVQGLVIKVS